jgi:hypothetical protein
MNACHWLVVPIEVYTAELPADLSTGVGDDGMGAVIDGVWDLAEQKLVDGPLPER